MISVFHEQSQDQRDDQHEARAGQSANNDAAQNNTVGVSLGSRQREASLEVKKKSKGQLKNRCHRDDNFRNTKTTKWNEKKNRTQKKQTEKDLKDGSLAASFTHVSSGA
jgi:hypothetical protein